MTGRPGWVIGVFAAVLALQGCASSTFVAGKEGKGYYVGSSSDAAYRMFCESSDLERIPRSATGIGQEMKGELYRSNWGSWPVER